VSASWFVQRASVGARRESPRYHRIVDGSDLRRIRLITLYCLALLCAGLTAAIAYWSVPPSCQSDARAVAGEVKRRTDGKLLYFDGTCWTTKPMPPRDTPF
jgi:hypothetical protein